MNSFFRRYLILFLICCGRGSPSLPGANTSEQTSSAGIGDAVEVVVVHLHLRGTGGSGLSITRDGAEPVLMAPGADVDLEAPAGQTLHLEGAPLARLNQGGARVVAWGASGCVATDVTCAVTVAADVNVTVVIEDLLYVARLGQTDNVQALSFDGTGGRSVTHFTAPGLLIEQPTLSPDGQFLAYVSNRALLGDDTTAPARNLWLMPAHGGEGKALTHELNVDVTDPSWSPDSQDIVFTRAGSLHVIHLSDGKTRDLSDAAASHATFSPDGHLLAAFSTQVPSLLWIYSADGSASHWLTDIPAWAGQAPIFDAAGTSVAFVACDNLSCTQRSAATVRLDGGYAGRLQSLASGTMPAIAADAEELHLLRAKSVSHGPWPPMGDFTPTTVTDLQGHTPVMIAAGGVGTVVVTEAVDPTSASNTWLLRTLPRHGAAMEKPVSAGTLRALILSAF